MYTLIDIQVFKTRVVVTVAHSKIVVGYNYDKSLTWHNMATTLWVFEAVEGMSEFLLLRLRTRCCSQSGHSVLVGASRPAAQPRNWEFSSTRAMPSATRATKQVELTITWISGRRKLEQTGQFPGPSRHSPRVFPGLVAALLPQSEDKWRFQVPLNESAARKCG